MFAAVFLPTFEKSFFTLIDQADQLHSNSRHQRTRRDHSQLHQSGTRLYLPPTSPLKIPVHVHLPILRPKRLLSRLRHRNLQQSTRDGLSPPNHYQLHPNPPYSHQRESCLHHRSPTQASSRLVHRTLRRRISAPISPIRIPRCSLLLPVLRRQRDGV